MNGEPMTGLVERRKLSSVCLSVQDLADLMGVCKDTVYDLLHRGVIPSIRTGRGTRAKFIVTRHAFEEWQRTCGLRIDPVTKH
jgi:excisionase family DNA binding protein